MSAGAGNDGSRVSIGGDILVRADRRRRSPVSRTRACPPPSARTFPATTSGPTSVRLTVAGQDVAAVRRTFGVVSDQGSVDGGAPPASSWIVLPAVAGSPSNPGLVLTNPGTEPAVVTLGFLSPGPRRAVTRDACRRARRVEAPEEFLAGRPRGRVLAKATSGTFVPAAASYSLGRRGVRDLRGRARDPDPRGRPVARRRPGSGRSARRIG